MAAACSAALTGCWASCAITRSRSQHHAAVPAPWQGSQTLVAAAAAAPQAASSRWRPARAQRLAAVAQAGSNGSAPVRVSLSVPECRLAFGEHLRVVGSCAELGGWRVEAAPSLVWQEGDNWTAAVALPPGDHTFKLVIVRQDNSQIWEDGGDRSLQLARTPAARVTCRFGDTSSTQLEAGRSGQPSGSLQPVQEAADAAAARVAELQRGVADLTKRKQQLAARLAGLEQAVQSGRRSSLQPPPAAPNESQLQTGWLFRSQDEGDYATATTLASSVPPSRSPALVAALLPILVPLSAAAMFFAAKGLDVPIESYLPKQVPQLESLLPKTASLLPKTDSLLQKTETYQAALPKPPPAPVSPAPPAPAPAPPAFSFSYFGFR